MTARGQGVITMSDKEILKCLRRLKDEGFTYKWLSREIGIPTEHFYRCTHRRVFPYEEKRMIEGYLLRNFKEVIYDECFPD